MNAFASSSQMQLPAFKITLWISRSIPLRAALWLQHSSKVEIVGDKLVIWWLTTATLQNQALSSRTRWKTNMEVSKCDATFLLDISLNSQQDTCHWAERREHTCLAWPKNAPWRLDSEIPRLSGISTVNIWRSLALDATYCLTGGRFAASQGDVCPTLQQSHGADPATAQLIGPGKVKTQPTLQATWLLTLALEVVK